jgi:hypothetical protein
LDRLFSTCTPRSPSISGSTCTIDRDIRAAACALAKPAAQALARSALDKGSLPAHQHTSHESLTAQGRRGCRNLTPWRCTQSLRPASCSTGSRRTHHRRSDLQTLVAVVQEARRAAGKQRVAARTEQQAGTKARGRW